MEDHFDEFRNYSYVHYTTNMLKLFLLKNIGHGSPRKICSCGKFFDQSGVEEKRNKVGLIEEPENHICVRRIDQKIAFFKFPIYLSYLGFSLMIFPFQTLNYVRGYAVKEVVRSWYAFSMSVLSVFFVSHLKSAAKTAVRLSRAFLWSIYVWCVLVGLLVSGFVVGGLAIRSMVEEPVKMTRALNFDYTKNSPAAFVSIMPNGGIEDVKNAGVRAIPYNHNLQLTVSMTMPESEYNRKLGVFQVKVELVSADGQVTASQSLPRILRFKSEPIRFIETSIKSAALLTGFGSESQTLTIRMTEFTEGNEPTTFLKVSLVQRAEFQSGSGIPEIYAATLDLQSELPPLKRIVWLWRRTIFVWVSFISFLTELVSVVVICRVILIQRRREEKMSSGFIEDDLQTKVISC